MEMRIVGRGNGFVIIQHRSGSAADWKQDKMDDIDFLLWMAKNFPEYCDCCGMVDYLYHYGEDAEMIRKGEAFVFRSK